MLLSTSRAAPLAGVFPVISTPFTADGRCDTDGFAALLRYVGHAGAPGAVYPAIASEFASLSDDERTAMVAIAARQCAASDLRLIVGVSAETIAGSQMFARQARESGAAAIMVMAPRAIGGAAEDVAAFVAAVAEAAPDIPVVLQNAPPPLGSALTLDAVCRVVERIPQIRYVKEENVPCGQRITGILSRRVPTLLGAMGGAGGRFVLDEYARGACGSMPACDLVEVHVAIWNAVRYGDLGVARALFTRVLPLLNMAAIHRQHVVKRVLKHRGLIACDLVRDTGTPVDDHDRHEIDTLVAELADLMTVEAGYLEAAHRS